MCESFGCVPSVARREIENDPRLVFDILEMRAFREAKTAVDRDGMNVQRTPMVLMYLTIEGEAMRRKLREQRK